MASPQPAPSQEPHHGGAGGTRPRGAHAGAPGRDTVGAIGVASEVPGPGLRPEVAEFVRLVLAAEEAQAFEYARRLLDTGMSAEQLFEGIFAETARELGAMWMTDDCSFYEVTSGTGRIQRLVREFSHQFLAHRPMPSAGGRILLTCASNEQHSLGVAMLGEFFIRDGWDVQIGPWLGSEELLDKVGESEYNLLGFSVSVSSRISKLQQDIRRARQVSRNRKIRVIVGGSLIATDPSLAERIGADGFATDAQSALREARRLLSA